MRPERHDGKRRILAECGGVLRRDVGSRPVETVGRSLQVLGLILLPMGLFYGFDGGPNAMSLELGFLAAGAAAFLVGLRLQCRRGE